MADNLTVETRGVAPAAPRQAASDGGKAAESAELDKLRNLAKAKHGKALNERTLKAILERRKAKVAQEQKISENKEAFAKEQAKETVSSKAQDIRTRAQKTTGAKEARGADGLTSEDRQSVRSDPKSGPRLPPTQAKATTPEKANELLALMLAPVQIEDEVFDLEAYAKTLEQAPPSKPKDAPEQAKQARTTQGRQMGEQAHTARGQQPLGQQAPKAPLAQKSSGLSSTSHGSTNQNAPGQQQSGRAPTATRQPGSAQQQAGSQPGPSGRAGGPGTRQPGATPGQAGGPGATPGRTGTTATPMASQATSPGGAFGMPTTAAKLCFRAGASNTRLSSTSVSDDGLFNAGGGLITNSSFDGMHFNWDAFFSLFLIKSQKDLQEWRKLMKELRRLEGDLAVQGHKTDIALTKMRQHFERQKELRKSMNAFGEAREAFRKGQVRAVSGHDPSRVGERTQQMRDVIDRARKQGHDVRGGPHLTESQIKSLPKKLQDEYRNLRNGLRTDGGINAEYELALNTANNADNLDPPLTDAQKEELRREVSALETEKNQLTARMMRDPVQAAMLNEQRNAMAGREKELASRISELRKKERAHKRGGPGAEALTKEELHDLESLQKERFGVLRRIMILDLSMGRVEPRREGQTKAYHAAIDKTVAAERRPVRSAVKAIDDEIQHMDTNSEETRQQRIDRLEQRVAKLKQEPEVAKYEAEHRRQAQDSPVVADFYALRQKLQGLRHDSPEAKEARAEIRQIRGNAAVKEHLAWRSQQYAHMPRLAEIDQINRMIGEDRGAPADETHATRRARLTRMRGRIASGVGRHWSPAFRTGDNALRSREEYLRRLVDGDPTSSQADGQGDGAQNDSPVERLMAQTTEGNVDMGDLANATRDLEGLVNAGRHIQEARRKFVHDLKQDSALDRIDDAIEGFADAVDKSYGRAVNKAVQGAIGMAKRHRKEVDGEIRAVAQRAQGMINQLVQLLGVSRSR